MTKQLKTRQICLFFLAFVPATKLFMLPSLMAEYARQDMWICALFNLALDGLTLGLILHTCKKTNKDFYGLLVDNFGKTLANIIVVIYAVYFLLKAFMPIQEQKEFVKLSLYINMPTDLLFLPFFIASFYLCIKPLRVFGRVSDIVWFFALFGFLLLVFLSVSNVDWGALLPVGETGITSITNGSFRALNWWGDCAYALFFIGNFNHGKKANAKILLTFLACGLMVIFAFMIFWGTFTSIAFRQKFAMTELSKYTTVINNVGRFDYVGILFILFSCVFSLSIPIYFACHLLQQVFNPKKRWIIPLVVNALFMFFMLLLNQKMNTVTHFFITVMPLVFLIMGNLLPALTVFLKIRQGGENEKNNA